jgi:cytochrome c2
MDQSSARALLASPEHVAPGTATTLVGMPNAVERADVIACLACHHAGRE